MKGETRITASPLRDWSGASTLMLDCAADLFKLLRETERVILSTQFGCDHQGAGFSVRQQFPLALRALAPAFLEARKFFPVLLGDADQHSACASLRACK